MPGPVRVNRFAFVFATAFSVSLRGVEASVQVMIAALALLGPLTFPATFEPDLGATASYVMTRRYVDSEDQEVTEWKDRVKAMVQQRESSGAITLSVTGQPMESKSRDQWKYQLTLGKRGEFRDRSEDSEDALLAIRYAMAGLVIRHSGPIAVGETWAAGQAPEALGGTKWAYTYRYAGDETLPSKSVVSKIAVTVQEKSADGFSASGWVRISRKTQLIHDGQWKFSVAFLPGDELQVPQTLTLGLAAN